MMLKQQLKCILFAMAITITMPGCFSRPLIKIDNPDINVHVTADKIVIRVYTTIRPSDRHPFIYRASVGDSMFRRKWVDVLEWEPAIIYRTEGNILVIEIDKSRITNEIEGFDMVEVMLIGSGGKLLVYTYESKEFVRLIPQGARDIPE